MKLLIKGGRVVDPANNLDKVCDILIEGTQIAKVASGIKSEADTIINASGKIIMPGGVDMHVHLREPGREDKETVCSATKAALHGGMTCVLAMPNTNPVPDCAANFAPLKEAIKKSAKAHVVICGAITKGRKGLELSDIAGLKKEGVAALSDDGASVDDDGLMLEALKLAAKEDLLVICHSEDKSLSNNGAVNAGFCATRMGLRGLSRESEYKRVERDIKLAKKAGARLHIAHVSVKESLELIAQAKKEGIKVTCEVTPHHFTLSEEVLTGYDTNFKMNPPLRSSEDVLAMQRGLAEGIIDAIASDHAPHTENEKDIEFERAEFGVVGLETELSVAISELVEKKLLSWPDLARLTSFNPAQILKINKGALSVGADADIIVIDPDKEWQVAREGFLSKSKNSAFLGRTLKGKVDLTFVAGKVHKW